MVLSENVAHSTGRVLLKANSELTEKHKQIFKAWGIASVKIKSQDDEVEKTNGDFTQAEIKQAFDEKKVAFQYCDLKDPLIKQLFKVSIKNSLQSGDEIN